MFNRSPFLMMRPIHFLLASQSPRRRELLGLLPYPFEIAIPDVDEDFHLDREPDAYVLHTAEQKGEAIATGLTPSANAPIIIAADTTVALEGEILGKPGDNKEARNMLLKLRGRTHQVHTGLCVVDIATGRRFGSVHTAAVTMRHYSAIEVDAYIATGDPFDKAGAYAIQHPLFQPVERLEGCFLGVMGLSVCDLIDQLIRNNIHVKFDAAVIHAAHQGFACPILVSTARMSRFDSQKGT
ncbi:MAG: Maf family protein [Chloroflexota bacterium]